MGRDEKYDPNEKDRQIIVAMRINGVSVENICKIMDISKPTIYKYYDKELRHALDMCNGVVATKFFDQCMAGNVAAQIFWLKTKARWSTQHDMGENNTPVQQLKMTRISKNALASPDSSDE